AHLSLYLLEVFERRQPEKDGIELFIRQRSDLPLQFGFKLFVKNLFNDRAKDRYGFPDTFAKVIQHFRNSISLCLIGHSLPPAQSTNVSGTQRMTSKTVHDRSLRRHLASPLDRWTLPPSQALGSARCTGLYTHAKMIILAIHNFCTSPAGPGGVVMVV